jgi:hypothetical protein
VDASDVLELRLPVSLAPSDVTDTVLLGHLRHGCVVRFPQDLDHPSLNRVFFMTPSLAREPSSQRISWYETRLAGQVRLALIATRVLHGTAPPVWRLEWFCLGILQALTPKRKAVEMHDESLAVA